MQLLSSLSLLSFGISSGLSGMTAGEKQEREGASVEVKENSDCSRTCGGLIWSEIQRWIQNSEMRFQRWAISNDRQRCRMDNEWPGTGLNWFQKKSNGMDESVRGRERPQETVGDTCTEPETKWNEWGEIKKIKTEWDKDFRFNQFRKVCWILGINRAIQRQASIQLLNKKLGGLYALELVELAPVASLENLKIFAIS